MSVGDQRPRKESVAAYDKLRLQWWTRAVREGRGTVRGDSRGIGLVLAVWWPSHGRTQMTWRENEASQTFSWAENFSWERFTYHFPYI